MNELKNQLIEVCNSSGLPLEAIIFVLKDVFRDAEDTLRRLEEQTKDQKQEEQS